MTIHSRTIAGLFALAAILPLAFPSGPAQAQQPAAPIAAPRIDGFDVAAVKKPVAGHELAFTLYGSPGGTANVRIGGATGILVLEENHIALGFCNLLEPKMNGPRNGRHWTRPHIARSTSAVRPSN